MFGNTPFASSAFSHAPIGVEVEVTGLSAVSTVGTVSVVAKASVNVTGIFVNANTGDEGIDAQANITGTGVSATVSAASVTIDGQASVDETGLQLTSTVDAVTVSANSVLNVTGVSATTAVGIEDTDADANADVTGVDATGSVDSVEITTGRRVEVTGVEASTAIGDETVGIGINVLNDDLGPGIDRPWTSMNSEGYRIDRTSLVNALTLQFFDDIEILRLKGFSPFVEEFFGFDLLKDKVVEVIGIHSNKSGIAKGISEQGLLLVEIDGELESINAGEVSIRW